MNTGKNGLSRRLQAVADLVSPGKRVCDVGCDHGYVSIYLIESGRADAVLAMDVNRGPLERARINVEKHGLTGYITLRLSNGLDAYRTGEAQSLVIAGMGGRLMQSILTKDKEKTEDFEELILQPQSELCSVREYLAENGYVTEAERMVFEDGKYYPMMRVHYQAEKNEDADKTIKDMENSKEQKKSRYKVECLYGRYLLMEKNPVLHQYLVKERQVFENILDNLFKQPESEKIAVRMEEVKEALGYNEAALAYYRT